MPYPILAEKFTWYTQGNTATQPTSFNKIDIVDSYTVTGSETESWDASASKDGSIMVYTNGKTLTIAGNGSGKIALSQDASQTFYISSITEINGLELLDLSNTVNTSMMFRQTSVTTLNISNWDVSNVTNMYNMFAICRKLTTLDIGNWDVGSVTNMSTMFSNCNALKNLDISNWDVGSVTNMESMFYGCFALESLDLSNWNVSKVENFKQMFYRGISGGNMNIREIGTSGWDTSSATNMYWMFFGCSSLETLDVSNWNVSNVTDMSYMFAECISLTTLDTSNWKVSKVQDFSAMFASSSSEIPMLVNMNTSGWDTSSATDMSFMFYGCRNAQPDVSNWDVSKVKNFDHMFAHSYMKAVDVSKWDTSSATNMYCMLHSIQSEVIDVSSFDTSNVIAFGYMFKKCNKLIKIIGLENFDTSKGVDFSQMFYDCNNLKELNLSSFDTTKAKDGEPVSDNGSTSLTMSNMFTNMYKLSKITLGTNFSFNGDGTTTKNVAVIPIPSSEYIRRANGKWYNESDELIDTIPDKTAGTYYAVPSKYREYVLITRGSVEDIADSIRAVTGESTKFYPADMSTVIANITPEQGGESSQDWWEAYQQSCESNGYQYAFSRACWIDDIYAPVIKIVAKSGLNHNEMFRNSTIEDVRVEVDFQQSGSTYIFSTPTLERIPLLKVVESVTFTNWFANCKALTEIIMSGTIGNDINFQFSPLNKGSIESIVSCLSSTASGKTLTLKESAVIAAFGSTSSDEWIELITPKSNQYDGTWTISLV